MNKPYGLQFRMKNELIVRWFKSAKIRKDFLNRMKKRGKVERIREMNSI